jgi:L-asparaginase
MTIKIFITGGTFNKEYNYITGQLYFKDTHLKEMLKLGRSSLDVDIRTLMMGDSLSLTDEDRNLIVHNCIKTHNDRILITHGKDTMTETSRMLADSIKDKTIVITGAMIPYPFGSSEGSSTWEVPLLSFNLCLMGSILP